MKKTTLIFLTTSLALASLGYYFYQKQKVKKLNEKVSSLEDTLKELEELKNK
jgi:uncharacterized protein HemX